VYVTNRQSDNVSVINGTSVLTSIALPALSSPWAATYDSANGYVYVADSGSDQVSVLSGTSVIASIPVGFAPVGLTFDPDNGYVYVVNRDSDNVTVLLDTAVVAWIDLFPYAGPAAATFDSANGYVYVSNLRSSNLSVINGTSVIASLVGGQGPVGAAFDDANGYLYVADSGRSGFFSNPGAVLVLNGSSYYPVISSYAASPSQVEIGSATISTTTLEVIASRGAGNSSYAYTGLPAGCSSFSTAALNCTPAVAGVFPVHV
jgi:YVTN family beta-propeller protein